MYVSWLIKVGEAFGCSLPAAACLDTARTFHGWSGVAGMPLAGWFLSNRIASPSRCYRCLCSVNCDVPFCQDVEKES
jgi:hypothetical protein